MSEAELHMLKGRLIGGVLSKAQRGELRTLLPVGLVYDEQGKVILDPDQQVQQSLRVPLAHLEGCGGKEAHPRVAARSAPGYLYLFESSISNAVRGGTQL